VGKACEVITARATNPGATGAAPTVNTGDSLTVRDSEGPGATYLEGVWYGGATRGFIRVTSARLHDNVQGIRLRAPAARQVNLLPPEFDQRLHGNDTLALLLAGGAAETDMLGLLVYYEDVGGLDARLASWEQIKSRIVNIAGQEITHSTSATTGDWSAGAAINEDFDNFKADTKYAVLGYICDPAVGALAIRGSDTGNVKIGGPGDNDPIETRRWFVKMSERTGRPHIPVISSANKASTLVFVADPAVSTAIDITLILAELSG